jgi:hypothetical protein
LALSTCSNISVILAILFGKLAKTPAIAEATLVYPMGYMSVFCTPVVLMIKMKVVGK